MRLRVEMSGAQRFVLNLRYPEWAAEGYELTVNGRPVKQKAKPGSYISVNRKWRSGDEVRFVLRQSLHSEPIPGDSTLRAYFYGPVVLSSVLEDKEEIPVIVADDVTDVSALVKCTDKKRLRFETLTAQPVQKELIPYYEVGGRRMMVYFQHFPETTWKEHIQDQIVQSLGTVDRGVKERPGLAVLRETDMPAVLVETAFITNKDDVQLLMNQKDEFARAIARGVTDYVAKKEGGDD